MHGGPVYGTQAPVIENFLRVIATCGDNNRKSFSVREAGVVLSRLLLLSYDIYKQRIVARIFFTFKAFIKVCG